MDKLLLGRRIKEARIARDYTLDELASAVGLNKSTISRYERGEIESPKLPVIEAIATQLHTNPSWLIGKSDDRTFTPPNSKFSLYSPCSLFAPLRNLRVARGLSLEEAAYKIGISTEDYIAIENGHNTDCITLARIAEFFCCSADFILAFDGVSNEDQHIAFTQDTLFRLHRTFKELSAEDQEKVIKFSQMLLHRSEPTLRIAARNGSFHELNLSEQQLSTLLSILDQLPDASDDL